MKKQRSDRGYFLTFEGIEGVGKTTAINGVCSQLTDYGMDYVVTREPGGTPIAEAIRDVLLGHYDAPMSPHTELLMMFAGRAQNISEVILPALHRGQWVLSDRFTDASLAYQGGGRGIPHSYILSLKHWIQGDLVPDLTFLLDAPVSVGLARMHARGKKDRLESEGIDFFERVRRQYLLLAQEESERFRVIDAQQSVAMVHQQIWTQMRSFLAQE